MGGLDISAIGLLIGLLGGVLSFWIGRKLRLKRLRKLIFGLPSEPYPEFYTPKSYSKSFVMHIDPWYAQSHPTDAARRSELGSVPEVAHPSEYHREARLVGSLDDIFVADRAARLDHCGRTRFGRGEQTVGEREERVGGHRTAYGPWLVPAEFRRCFG